MRRHLTAMIAVCLLAAVATLSGASYVSELLFLGEGSYDHNANPADPMGYGEFGRTSADFNLSLRIPDEACRWYLSTDVAITFSASALGRGTSHVIRMDEVGIWADQHVVEWSDLGYSWDAQRGIDIGYHDPTQTRSQDPYNIMGDYSWDLDGGGDDIAASISPSTSEDYAYHIGMEQMRSMSWLATMPLGSILGGFVSPFLGGLPLDGLEFGLNTLAPFYKAWDVRSYDIAYRGKVLLTADAACPVPEPGTVLLFGTGLAAMGSLGIIRRRRRTG